MPTAIPTMSSIGWVSTIEEKGDRAVSYFLTSEYSQSVLYYGNISSLQWLVKTYGHDPIILEREVSEALDGLMARYFENRSVTEVRVLEDSSDTPGKLTIQFSCIVREGNREYSIGRRVQFLNATIIDIAKINNG